MTNATTAGKARKVAVAGAVLAALGAPMAVLAVPAEAAVATTDFAGCKVTPKTPIYVKHNDAGQKVIRFRVVVECGADRTARVDWIGYEEDWSTWWKTDRDDTLFSTTKRVSFTSAGTTTLWRDLALPDTESGAEEIYHKVRFSVTSNGVPSQATKWERTPYVSFTN